MNIFATVLILLAASNFGDHPVPKTDSSELIFQELEPLGFEILEVEKKEGVHQAFVSYLSDGLKVRAYVFCSDEAKPRPLIVFNHGGISGVSNDMKWRSRHMVEDGYVVVTPSYRGEDGGEGDIEVAKGEVNDVLTVTKLLAAWQRVDEDRIGISGSSHGALISMLAVAREPELYRAVAAACGVMDVNSWYSYLVEEGFDVSDSLSVAIYGSGPESKPEAFRIRRAIDVADQIKIPVLIQQGQVDRIVPPFQARLMQEALIKSGHRQTQLLEYPLLGHAFWFWNDLRYHTQQENDQGQFSWIEYMEFMNRHVRDGQSKPN
ncbi:MAG: prolyl oligopeptidase family serine peptidase [Candidatus Eisenbacteria bacterium]|uniref:Prolyl oligopeptidase family serine peptidase n=1 Tax=Eiseniibacteriota bacterium TaxID=2212470 RepID=A0A7Y2E8M9_UNCEI|nr:prolyl oligopeptidase family serine peptidase [Candidatus Eisenbacteria bacterium]